MLMLYRKRFCASRRYSCPMIACGARSIARPLLLSCAVTLLTLSGCAGVKPLMSSGPSPRVEDCMMQQAATPTRFVCDGKTYTSVELADLRKNLNASTH